MYERSSPDSRRYRIFIGWWVMRAIRGSKSINKTRSRSKVLSNDTVCPSKVCTRPVTER